MLSAQVPVEQHRQRSQVRIRYRPAEVGPRLGHLDFRPRMRLLDGVDSEIRIAIRPWIPLSTLHNEYQVVIHRAIRIGFRVILLDFHLEAPRGHPAAMIRLVRGSIWPTRRRIAI